MKPKMYVINNGNNSKCNIIVSIKNPHTHVKINHIHVAGVNIISLPNTNLSILFIVVYIVVILFKYILFSCPRYKKFKKILHKLRNLKAYIT